MTFFEVLYYSPHFFKVVFITLLVLWAGSVVYLVDGIRKYGYWMDKDEEEE